MTYRQSIPGNPHIGNIDTEQQPILAWLAISALVLFTAVCLIGGIGSIFRPAYILLSFAVGVLLYARYPTFYLGFTWWMWFVTPFVSRVIDFRTAFDESRLLLVAPYLVTLITLYGCLKNLPRSYREGGLPFVLALIGVSYGFLMGMVNTSAFTAARAMLDWLTPISFAFYLFINWRNYPRYRQVIQTTFVWGVLVTGVYGIYQYIVAPEWDKFWLISTKLASMGNPAPFQIRVWSTMHSPGPFAVMMMAGLLLLLNGKGFLNFPAAGAGYLAFLLSMVRVMWGCWVVGLLAMFTSIRPKLQMRLIITMLIMALCVIPLSTMEPFADAINDRLQTFSNLEKDDSTQVRQKIYENGLNSALSNVLGNGIGNTFIVNKEGKLESIVVDSGILETFITLGWFGAVIYVGGLVLLLLKVLQATELQYDTFLAAARAIGFGCVIGIPIFSIMLGNSGMIMWSFLAIALAGHKYYQHQLINRV
ncbi:O-antigen ligase family protein [Calothrix sp. UHCC 0171]|uniref:O-antigen ligase family protein n=1 Tax=Calothrix sp. UHCC 0171 TaxID=3110245 RepID=UPI002B1F7C04|nr:O-antigen ligase family protein [Calothrix sp. UHCC 0171]MEA5571600.1 O-antigen ligase family protein [Calothrix sp. UHCC 0171]